MASASEERLAELSRKAAPGPWFVRARPTNEGFAVIEDGRQHGLAPIVGEWPEIEFVVALVNHYRETNEGAAS